MLGRPRFGWMGGVRVALGIRGFTWKLRDSVRRIRTSGET